eukprot:GHRR01017771.1.p2 GENE.GHRR01017771.1~~GHRR01017771.1.p2  ORF type:complete len:111 (+),score=14.34 GHRR01017771.1:389-721(+)
MNEDSLRGHMQDDHAPMQDCSAQRIPALSAELQGINVTSLREIKLLREIKSPYIVELIDVFPHKRKLNMVRCHLLLLPPPSWNRSACSKVHARALAVADLASIGHSRAGQ